LRHRKPEDFTENGHVVLVYDKTRLIERREYPTYGKASWGVLELEQLYPDMTIKYLDQRVFKTDTYV
jgi:hypothetical protein